ncbi:MAG: thioredoxin:protein disulfide reductase [Thiomicrorhabdus sp.]|nr:MAG: thioredoxin:protein disulfide reductase [Thiomicrorhabdus sp.]
MLQKTPSIIKALLKTLFIGIISLASLTQVSVADGLLSVDDAFKLDQPKIQQSQIILNWQIADGYHLYKNKIEVHSENSTFETPIFPAAKLIDDPVFGKTETYTDTVEVKIPFDINSTQNTLNIDVKYQGCQTQMGVCYPPQTRNFTLTVPVKTNLVAQPFESQTKESAFSSLGALNDLFTTRTGQPDLLPADKAFQFIHQINTKGQLELLWQIADDYHLYQDKFKVSIIEGDAVIGSLQLPKAEQVDDPVFGKTEVFHGQLLATLPISKLQDSITIEIEFQGCAISSGVCYPPIKKTVSVSKGDIQLASQTTIASSSSDSSDLSESDQIADTIKNSSVWIVIGTFFILGLLLTFTPCVFPMVPILSSIIVGQGKHLTTKRALIMSLVYVLAMSITYTVAGVLAGMFGENLQIAFQNPWIIGSFSFIFVLLAFSMFGFYELQLPARLQAKLTHASNQQKGGTLMGVAIMGFLSALIVGPCVAPPLMGALIYIGQTGDALLGGLALFAMSMGMGVPLLIIGTTSAKFLPRSGAWMDNVKAVFGVMLIGVAIWMLERIVPVEITMINWALLFIVSAVYLGAFDSHEKIGWLKLAKGLGLALFLYGLMILIGLLGGSKDMYQPLKTFQGSAVAGQAQNEHLTFKTIKNINDLEAEIAKGRPIMLDFYADWCISCKEMEKLTFTDPNVHLALRGVTLLQSDVTANDDIDKALMKHFGLIGPPAILFFNPQGQEQKAQRVIGFKSAEDFTINIKKALH